jgi:hypothetical protein
VSPARPPPGDPAARGPAPPRPACPRPGGCRPAIGRAGQVAAAALLADVSRTNVFMGRLAQGLRSDGVGEHTCLEAQRVLRRLRTEAGVKTQLIVASMRDWRSLPRLAGCDVFTAPVDVLDAFLAQREVAPDRIANQVDTAPRPPRDIPGDVRSRIAEERIPRLWRVEPELVEFLLEVRGSPEYARAVERGMARGAIRAGANEADGPRSASLVAGFGLALAGLDDGGRAVRRGTKRRSRSSRCAPRARPPGGARAPPPPTGAR